jgi:hypothetical protein
MNNNFFRQTNQMVLLKMHKDYLDSAPIWKSKLETHSGRLNAKKEEVNILFKIKFFNLYLLGIAFSCE